MRVAPTATSPLTKNRRAPFRGATPPRSVLGAGLGQFVGAFLAAHGHFFAVALGLDALVLDLPITHGALHGLLLQVTLTMRAHTRSCRSEGKNRDPFRLGKRCSFGRGVRGALRRVKPRTHAGTRWRS